MTSKICFDNPPLVNPIKWSNWGLADFEKLEWTINVSLPMQIGDEVVLAKLPPPRHDGTRHDVWACLYLMQFNEDNTLYRSAFTKVEKDWIDYWEFLW